MYKTHPIVMLPTNQKAHNIYCVDNLEYHTDKRLSLNGAEQHLYVISEEEIKEGDWYIDDGDNVRQSVTSDNSYWERRSDYMKIIATTDKSLNLPSIPHSFIAYFIEQYNLNNAISSVEVEYEDTGEEDWIGDDYNGEPFWNENLELYVNKNNEISIKLPELWKFLGIGNNEEKKYDESFYALNAAITILKEDKFEENSDVICHLREVEKSLKETKYSREEVERLLYKIMRDFDKEKYTTQYRLNMVSVQSLFPFESWCKENLKP
jgi:hypothetical protein